MGEGPDEIARGSANISTGMGAAAGVRGVLAQSAGKSSEAPRGAAPEH
jgi:hypothetical protein